MRRPPLPLALLVLVAACSARPATQVTVYVDAQPLVRERASALRIVLRGGPAEGPLVEVDGVEPSPLRWPSDVTLIPADHDASRVFEVQATAYDDADRPITVARLRGGYVEGTARTLRLTLEDACIGTLCSAGFTCRAGECVPLTTASDDAGAPPDAGPDGGSGPCTDDGSCSDGRLCNGVEVCRSGVCEPGTPLLCDDGLDCTDDGCEGDGCVFIPRSERCTAAAEGTCDPVNGCQYATCDTATTCRPEGCRGAECVPQGDGTVLCVRATSCGAGQECCGDTCVAADCDDGDPCTLDACDAAAGACAHPIDPGRVCSDGDACTVGDTCAATGACTPGAPRSCDDANACTTNTCNPADGTCTSVPDDSRSCDDLNPCTANDRCSGGVCVADMGCDDGIACTRDSCRGAECMHVANDADCGSGGTCDLASGGCVFPTGCNATNCATTACENAVCMGDLCMRSSRCTGTQTCCGGVCMDCDDHNPCTTDGCSGTGSCTHVPTSGMCNDSNACTTGDACVSGVCQGTAVACDDANPCTTDTCAPAFGCQFAAAPPGTGCSDGNACTSGDTCTGSTCGGTPITCMPVGGCYVAGTCNPATGCTMVPRAAGTDCGTEPSLCIDATCDGAGNCMVDRWCVGPTRLCCDGTCVRPSECI